jgi:hypothetical protein
MALATWLNVFGPLLAVIGSLLMAFDIWRSPLRARRRALFEPAMEKRATFYDDLAIKFAGGEGRTDTQEQLAAEFRAHAKQERQSFHAAERLFSEQEAASAFKAGVWGFGYIAAGSAMQVVAALIQAIQ